MKILAAAVLLLDTAFAVPASAEFRDVPKDHWAAESIKKLKDVGIVQGYPDGTFKGDRPVTRYELAVALEALIQYVRASYQPVKETSASGSPQDWRQRSLHFLKTGKFLAADSPILADGSKPVTCEQLGRALAEVAAKLTEELVPPGECRDSGEAVEQAPH